MGRNNADCGCVSPVCDGSQTPAPLPASLRCALGKLSSHRVPELPHQHVARILTLRRQLVAIQADLHGQRELPFRGAAHGAIETDQLALRDRIFDSAMWQERNAMTGQRHRFQTFGHVRFVELVEI